MNIRFEDNLDEIIVALDDGARDCVNQTVIAIVDTATPNAPRAKGALQAGIYAVLEGEDNTSAYNEAARAVQSANSKAEVEPPFPLDNYTADGMHQAVADSITSYGPLIHNGYGNRAGRPFLEDAGNAHKSTFQANLDDIGDKLKAI